MNYGFENGKFFVEYATCIRQHGSLRSESDARARDLYAENQKLILCTSSGLDSQTALFSFMSQGIPITCAFMHLPGYNDYELEHIKLLENKYGHTTEIVSIDADKLKDEAIELARQFDTNPLHILHYKFLEQLPQEHDVVQVVHDPWIITRNNRHYIFHSFYDPEISRYESLKQVKRTGNIKLFGDSSEFFLSSITDKLFDHFLASWQYYAGNNLTRNGQPIEQVHRYDYYIKPMLYAKHWGNELLYFPKFSGYENIEWIKALLQTARKEKLCAIEITELVAHLKNINGAAKKFYGL
jgi:hypothetical protein